MAFEDLKKLLDKEILKNYNDSENGSWNEDTITRDVLRAIKSFMEDSSDLFFIVNKIKWNMYKATRSNNLEQKFGDIAFLIKLVFSETSFVEGAYFFEAKRFYFDSLNYQSINFDNAKKYIDYSHAHNFLLYTVNHEELFDSYQNALTLPTQHVVAYNSKSKDIEKSAEDFTTLLERLFCGYHLDYKKNVVDDAKGFVSNTGQKFKYLVNVAIPMNQELDFENQINLSNINHDNYEEFNEQNINLKENRGPRNGGPSGPTMGM